MTKRMQIVRNNCRGLNVLSVLSLLAAVAVAGCAGDYGRLVRSREVNEIFSSYQVLADHRYYLAGPEGRPDAVMGIQRDYTLQSTQWTRIDLTAARLKKQIEHINFHHHSRTRRYPYGFAILDHNGNRVGIWYSIWDWTTVHVEAEKRLKVFPPAKEDRFGNGDGAKRMKIN